MQPPTGGLHYKRQDANYIQLFKIQFQVIIDSITLTVNFFFLFHLFDLEWS